VKRDLSTPGATCFGTWTPTDAEWAQMQPQGCGEGGCTSAKVFYRARTRNDAGGNQRLSTNVGNGLFVVVPPYAVLTPDGRSNY
jgi:hypothetical protein